MIETASLAELRRGLEDPAVAVVDVLPAASFAAGHIPGAVNLPHARIDESVADVLPDPAQEVIVYCSGPT